jgi:probable HAF family extracellular repeat protein
MMPKLISGRNTRLYAALTIAILVAIAEWISPERSRAQTTTYIVLELPLGGPDHVPCRLNNLGDLVGRGSDSVGGGTGAVTWKHGTFKRKHFGVLPGGDYSSAFAINDAGDVAGASNTGTAIVPFIGRTTGGLQRIPLLRGDNCGQAFGINKSGDVAGYSSGPHGASGFLWTQRTGVRDLGSLPGGSYSRAFAVNDSGEVVGTSASPAGDRAVLWTQSGNVRDLGTLPGDTSSEATAINNAGEVVGYSKGPRGLHAFLWSTGTGMQDLGVLPGGHVSRALDINDSGAVVGSSACSSGDHAFIWTKQGGMTDLNSADSVGLGVVFIEAHSINNRGEILIMGSVMPPGGGTEQHVCAPAPPSTFLLKPASSG